MLPAHLRPLGLRGTSSIGADPGTKAAALPKPSGPAPGDPTKFLACLDSDQYFGKTPPEGWRPFYRRPFNDPGSPPGPTQDRERSPPLEAARYAKAFEVPKVIAPLEAQTVASMIRGARPANLVMGGIVPRPTDMILSMSMLTNHSRTS